MSWGIQQESALRNCGRWMNAPRGSVPQVRRLFGFAGTGKTTLAKHLVAQASGKWLFAALTGKAAHVLRQKGCEGATTLHSLIYRPSGDSKAKELLLVEEKINAICFGSEEKKREYTPEEIAELRRLEGVRKRLMEDNEPRFALWDLSPLSESSVHGIIVDEVSMVDRYLGKDIESFGKKILVLGDPAQLPPVGGGGYYTEAEPDDMLTEVHRQAADSGILRLATLVREGGKPKPELSSDLVVLERSRTDKAEIARLVLRADQVLCGRNATRKNMNRRHRELLGRTGVVSEKDRLVCLKNYRSLGLFNGSQWVVTEARDVDTSSKSASLTVRSEDGASTEEPTLACWLHHFVDAASELDDLGQERRDLCEFDYSYALTCHKAQGSQWPNVVVFDESSSFPEGWRWLYTAVTRASEKLTVML